MPNGAPHCHAVRVRYAETDQMGVAHHSAYVAWLEEARIAWLRGIGISYRDLEREILMPVCELAIRYRRPVRFDDTLDLLTTGIVRGPSRMVFLTEVRLAGSPVVHADAEVVVAAVDRQGRPVRLPGAVVQALMASSASSGPPDP